MQIGSSVWAVATLALLVAAGTAPAATLSAEALETAATTFVEANFASQGDVVVHVGSVPPLGRLAGTDADIRPRFLQTPAARGPLLVSLGIHKDGRTIAQRTVTVRLQVFREVVVAARGIDRHATLGAEDVRVERRDVRALPDGAFFDVEPLIGKRVRSQVRPGDVILNRAVEQIPVIARGDKVTLLVDSGGIRVSATGTSLADGCAGAAIEVRNDRSGKRLHGVVRPDGIVLVEGIVNRGGGK